MRRVYFPGLFLLLVLLQSHASDSDIQTGEYGPIYPEKTISFDTSLSAGPLLHLSGSGTGGGIQAEICVSDIIPRTEFGITGGWGFLSKGNENPLLFSYAGVLAAYSFNLLSIFRILPFIDCRVEIPRNSPGPDFLFETGGGIDFDMHINKRNYLSLTIRGSIPFDEIHEPRLYLGFGIKKSHPVMIEMPQVSFAMNLAPERFSPDDDGENDFLEIGLDIGNGSFVKNWTVIIYNEREEEFISWSGHGTPPLKITWNGYSASNELSASASNYSVRAKIEDSLGNIFTENREFITDILVKKEGDKYRILIPNIVFPPNSADFSLLPGEVLAQNTEIIKKIAAKLERYPEYQIRIEGHGNLDWWHTEELARQEQVNVLIPLTEARAGMIKTALIEQNIDEERISILGLGGSEPIIPFSDKENRWRNRRVEFILLK